MIDSLIEWLFDLNPWIILGYEAILVVILTANSEELRKHVGWAMIAIISITAMIPQYMNAFTFFTAIPLTIATIMVLFDPESKEMLRDKMSDD